MHKVSNEALLRALSEPSVVLALKAAQERNWLNISIPDVTELFKDNPEHSAKPLLTELATDGGPVSNLELGLVAAFAVMAFIPTVMFQEIPPVALFMWGGLGVTLGLLVKRHPGILRKFVGK